MVNSLENIDKSKVYVDRIEGLDEVVGDWLYMNQNDKISVKGSNTISLKDNVELYALTNTDTNYPAIFYTDVDLDSLDLVDNTTIKLTLFIKTGIDVDGGGFFTYLIAPFTYINNAFYVNNPSSYEIPNDTFSIANDRFHFDGGGAIIYLTSIERNDQYDGIAYMSSSQLLPTQYAVKTYVDVNDTMVVHKTGEEYISGTKIFDGNFVIEHSPVNDTGNLIYKNTDISARGATINSDLLHGIRFSANNGNSLSDFADNRYTNGDSETLIRNYANDANGNPHSGKISIVWSKSAQNFYTYAPNPTDTTTTSGTQIATTGWVNTTGNNVVHKTNDETISGLKIFNAAIYNTVPLNDSRTGTFIARNMNYTLGTNPSSNIASQIQTKDSTDEWTSLFQYKYQTDGQVSLSMQCRKQDKSTSSSLAIGYQPNGSFFSYVPACDAAQSIVTTINKNKALNGYFQFGNGLIVQWGWVAMTTATSGTVTFPKAFTSTNSRTVANGNASGVVVYPTAESSTGFTWNKTSTNCAIKWIAIGY